MRIMPGGIPNCDTCHMPMKHEWGAWRCQQGCWGCGCCGRHPMRKEEDCGCWRCRCCELQPAWDIGCVNLAGAPCWKCGHRRGRCNCYVECACGFLHPAGYVCNVRAIVVTDEEAPF